LNRLNQWLEIVFGSNHLGPAGDLEGSLTFVDTFKGVAEQMKTPDGTVLLLDAGLISYALTFDLDTGEFISFEILVNNGPHPEVESDFMLFCEVLTDVLA
jgi:hypothetical protein